MGKQTHLFLLHEVKLTQQTRTTERKQKTKQNKTEQNNTYLSLLLHFSHAATESQTHGILGHHTVQHGAWKTMTTKISANT